MRVIEPISDKIDTPSIDRENLPVAFNGKVQIFGHILINPKTELMQSSFIP